MQLPSEPFMEVAERITNSLEEWGKNCFTTLFHGKARDWYIKAHRAGLKNLFLKIASESPEVIGWPWEALKEPEGSTLAHQCHIERQLTELHGPPSLTPYCMGQF